jgi:hypothetical protein
MEKQIYENPSFWLKKRAELPLGNKNPTYLWGNQNQEHRTNVLYTEIRKQAFISIYFSSFSSITEKLVRLPKFKDGEIVAQISH